MPRIGKNCGAFHVLRLGGTNASTNAGLRNRAAEKHESRILARISTKSGMLDMYMNDARKP